LVLLTVTNEGNRCWMTLQGRLDAAARTDFLRRLTHGRNRGVSLMPERMQAH